METIFLPQQNEIIVFLLERELVLSDVTTIADKYGVTPTIFEHYNSRSIGSGTQKTYVSCVIKIDAMIESKDIITGKFNL